MKFRIVLLICIGVMSAFLFGCSNNASQNVNNDVSENENQSENQNDSGETQTISILAHSNYDVGLSSVIEAFEDANPDIEVNLELAPFNELMESIEIRLSAQSTDIDLLFVDAPLVANYTLKGYLEPLDSYLSIDPNDVWVESAVNTVTYNNELMAAPLNNSSMVLFYNKELFDKKGIPYPEQDDRMTWEELVEIALELNDREDGVHGFTFDRLDRAYQLLPLADSLGASMLSEDGLTSKGYTNSPVAVEAFTFYYNLFNEWNISPRISEEESIDYFTSGRVAMFLGLSHSLPRLIDSNIDFGITLHPYFEGGEIATPTGSWSIGISKYSEQKEASAKFLNFLTVGDGADIMFKDGGILPVHLELIDHIKNDPFYDEFPHIATRIAAQESEETASPRPLTPGYLEWDSNMNRALQDIKNGTDPQDALDAIVDVIDRLLERYEGY
ncbi:multiple sugar transport system substrate-binding protein [Evansella vedderi]|uniref:Multiple sugar transport system substrate-binding protein n=1 Tax=Evansella vedderi TaxID=38282 RepID=A0ABT9ZPS3_9BACI|nr:sugar ABC transporter substrate-binding protein [Evansella vedderi]MDQ0252950.1 multiple sugar transport system substrate-binding protein [Evansella vedderi]